MLLIAFHVILRQISNYCFCTISSREFLSVLYFFDFPTMLGSICFILKNLGLPTLLKFFVRSSFKYTLWIISSINSAWTKHRLVVRNLTSL